MKSKERVGENTEPWSKLLFIKLKDKRRSSRTAARERPGRIWERTEKSLKLKLCASLYWRFSILYCQDKRFTEMSKEKRTKIRKKITNKALLAKNTLAMRDNILTILMIPYLLVKDGFENFRKTEVKSIGQ